MQTTPQIGPNSSGTTPRRSIGAVDYINLAHRLRAEAYAGFAAKIGRKFRALRDAGVRRFAEWRRREGTYRELARLDDHMLSDIGLTRYDVEALAAGRSLPHDGTVAQILASAHVLPFSRAQASDRLARAVNRHRDRDAA